MCPKKDETEKPPPKPDPAEAVTYATPEELEKVDDAEYDDLFIEEWTTKNFPKGMWFRFKELSATDKGVFEDKHFEYDVNDEGRVTQKVSSNTSEFRIDLIVQSLCAADGSPFFKDLAKGRAVIGARSSSVIEKMFRCAALLSGFAKEADPDDPKGGLEGES